MSKRLLDLLLVIDVEATCWEGEPPSGQENEIIEVGICTLDVATGERREKRSLLVNPELSQISPFCTQLTTLTQEQVDQGISFAEACTILQSEYLSHQRVWASYGDYDRAQFERQCHTRQIAYPFGSRHINIKTLFALCHGLAHEVGMARALEIAGITLEGTHHRGGDDAWNIAALVSRLMLKVRA
jgi:inhibitor of KinA sporulation pathway (predicted exonuclease)